MSTLIRVVTRGSLLALTQTRQLIDKLAALNPDFTFEINTLTTTGDRVTDRPLSQFRGIGVFVKELERALIDNEADIAVHSLKDVPVEQVEGLTLAAFPKRKDASDLLITKGNIPKESLRHGAIIGTSSPRRIAQLKAWRNDLVFNDLRGNLDTRLRKLDEENFDAIVVAAAGMGRLGKEFEASSMLPFDLSLPAAGQGCLTVECRTNDHRALAVLAKINDVSSERAIKAERDFLKVIGGGCHTPIAVYARVTENSMTITGFIADSELVHSHRSSLTKPLSDAHTIGTELANSMLTECRAQGIHLG